MKDERMNRSLILSPSSFILYCFQARSSVGERFLDTEEVGGSIPPVPTSFLRRQ